MTIVLGQRMVGDMMIQVYYGLLPAMVLLLIVRTLVNIARG
jgi:hypothetical protein